METPLVSGLVDPESGADSGPHADLDETRLAGSHGNAGTVVRIGDTVRRPWHPSTPATHELLAHLDRVLPGVAPVPVGSGGRDEQGREVLSWIDGDVATQPFPAWVAGEEFLVSLAQLLRRIHDALDGWTPPPGTVWSDEVCDPRGGPIIAHTDIWPGNVIARHGRAVALVDWEFAAPGRQVWDVASAAKLCVPFTAPPRRDPCYAGQDVVQRLRLFLDAYGLDDADRAILPEVLDERRMVGERFVLGRAARGEEFFVQKWDNADGQALLRAEQEWVKALPEDIARR
jgi:hypothetical protein